MAAGDRVQRIGNTVVQHGPMSDRVYAMQLPRSDVPEVLDEIERLACREGYGKLVAKAHGSDFGEFAVRDYRAEAMIPRFFGPHEAGVFMGKFLDQERADDPRSERIHEVLGAARREDGDRLAPDDAEFVLREADRGDAEALAACYREVFASYPFPIEDPGHVRAEMDRGTRFYTAWHGRELAAAASMEPGGAPGTVEMTDFATRPAHRGRHLARRLLRLMDRQAMHSGVRVAYTIARAESFAMNITFGRRAYRYGGTLINNTHIAGSIESMNVWSKQISTPRRSAIEAVGGSAART